MKHRLRRTLLASLVIHLLLLLVLPGLSDRETPEAKESTLRVQLRMEGPAGQTKRGGGQPDRAESQKQQQHANRASSEEQTSSEEKTASKPSPEAEDERPREQAEQTTTKKRSQPEAPTQEQQTPTDQTQPEESPPSEEEKRLVETTSGEKAAETGDESARVEGERARLAENPESPPEPDETDRGQESLVKSGGEQETSSTETSGDPSTSSSSSKTESDEPPEAQTPTETTTPSPEKTAEAPSSPDPEESPSEHRSDPPTQTEEEPSEGEESASPSEAEASSSSSGQSTEAESTESSSSSDQTLLTREGFFRSSSSSSQEPVDSYSNEGDRTSVTETFERVRIKKEKLDASTGGGSADQGTIEEPSGGSVVAEVPVVRVGSGEAKGTGDYALGVESGSSQTGYPKRSGRRVLHQPLPTVPPWLEKSGEEVRVVVLYTINGDGSIESMEIHTSSGYPSLDERVLNKVGQWRFEEGPDGEKRAVVFRFELTTAANA